MLDPPPPSPTNGLNERPLLFPGWEHRAPRPPSDGPWDLPLPSDGPEPLVPTHSIPEGGGAGYGPRPPMGVDEVEKGVKGCA